MWDVKYYTSSSSHIGMFYLRLGRLPLFFALSLLEHGFSLLGPLNVPAHSQHALQWLPHWPAVRFSFLHVEHKQGFRQLPFWAEQLIQDRAPTRQLRESDTYIRSRNKNCLSWQTLPWALKRHWDTGFAPWLNTIMPVFTLALPLRKLWLKDFLL